jgi:GxxExxY protein
MARYTHDNDKWLYHNLTEKIIGCCYKVHNELGCGHKEVIYEKALSKEFDRENIIYKKEAYLPVKYQNENVGNYRADFIIEGKILLEIKAVEFISKSYETQLSYYLKTTGYKLGLLINFGAERVQVRRRIWTL